MPGRGPPSPRREPGRSFAAEEKAETKTEQKADSTGSKSTVERSMKSGSGKQDEKGEVYVLGNRTGRAVGNGGFILKLGPAHDEDEDGGDHH